MGIRKTLRLLICLLLEQKVVLQSSDYNKLSLTILALVALLYPLQYMFPVIPLLPACMPDAEQLLLAPTPYLIGVPTAFYSARKIFRMPKDVWLADLDTRELSYPLVVDEIPELPEVESNILISHLRKLLHEFSNSPIIDLDLDESSKQWSYSSTRTGALELSKFDPLLYTLTRDSIDVAIRICMILFFNTSNVLGEFTDHIRTLRLFPRPVVAFQYESFMKSRPRPCLFTSMLAKTQAVEYFAESSICAQNEAYQRISSGVTSTELIGDKFYWYKSQLKSVYFDCWDKLFDCSNTMCCTPTVSTSSTLNSYHQSILLEAFEMAKFTFHIAQQHTNHNIDDGVDNSSMIDSSTDASMDYFSGIFKTYSQDTESINSHETLISSPVTSETVEDCIIVQPNKPLPTFLVEFYTPPTELVYATESTVNWSISPRNNEDTLSEFGSVPGATDETVNRNTEDRKNSQILTSTLLTSDSDSITRSSSVSSKRSTNDTLQLISRLSSSFLMSTENDGKRTPTNGFDNDKLSWDSSVALLFGDLMKSKRFRSLTLKDVPLSTVQKYKKRLENERTIIDLARSIKQGRIPNIFSRNHIYTLLQDENYRNLLIARINRNLVNDVQSNQQHIDDVAIEHWEQYKALVWVLKQMINGLERSFHSDIVFPTANHYDRMMNNRDKSPSRNVSAVIMNINNNSNNSSRLAFSTGVHKTGGLASAFMLMEVAHTHFYRLPNRTNQINPTAISNHGQHFIWNSMPSTPIAEKQSPLPMSKHLGNTIPYPYNRLDLSDSESCSRRSSKNEPFHHGRGELTNTILSMSEPTSDREDNDCIHHNKCILRSDSIELGKGDVKSTMDYKIVTNTISDSDDHTINNDDSNNSSTLVKHKPNNEKVNKYSATTSKLSDSLSELKLTNDEIPPDYIRELPIRKSQRSFGYRYHQSHLILTYSTVTSSPLEENDTSYMMSGCSLNICTPPAIYCPEMKFQFNDNSLEEQEQVQQQQILQPQPHQNNLCKISLLLPAPAPPCPSSPSSMAATSVSWRKKVPWTYIFEDVFDTEWQKSKIWGNLQFWEDSFLDAVAQERDILGMDFQPKELLSKYQSSSILKRKQMELEEDCLLVGIMHNMIAFMLMANVDRASIRKKLQRLLAKSHTGLHYSRKIGDLLNSLNYLNGNDIDLNMTQSRFIVQRSYEAYRGSDDSGELIFIEVCSDFLLIRNLSGRILERLWYDQIINMTYRSHSHILCITRQIEDHSQMDLFYTRKSRLVYQQIKEAMKHISIEASHGILDGDLDGEINAINVDNNQPGTISILADGFVIKFGDEQKFIKLHNIKRCCTIKSEIFTIDVYDQEKKTMITYRFQTDMNLQLFQNFVSLFSISPSIT
ncbi:unnamed protein product [Heterobilharzia americana]|nr:unnamed protein product [Heterobilharzia americana]